MAAPRRPLFISLLTILVILLSACAPLSKGVDQVNTDTPGNTEINQASGNTQEPAQAGSVDQTDAGFPRTPDPISIQVTLDTPSAVSQSSYEFPFIMQTKNADGVEYYMSIDNKLYTQKSDGSLATAFGTEVTMTPISSIEGLPFSQGFLAVAQFGPDGLIMGVPANVSLTIAGNHEKDYVGFAADGSGGDFHLYPMSGYYADSSDTTQFTFDISHSGIFGVAQVMSGEVETAQAHSPVSAASQDESDLAPLIAVKLPYDQMTPIYDQQQAQLEKSHSRLVKPLIDNLAGTSCDQVAATAYVFGEWNSRVNSFANNLDYFQPQIDSDANALHARFTACVQEKCPTCINGDSSQKTDPSKMDPFMVMITFAETLSFYNSFDDFGWWRQLSTNCAEHAGIQSPAGSTGGDAPADGSSPTPIPFTCSPN